MYLLVRRTWCTSPEMRPALPYMCRPSPLYVPPRRLCVPKSVYQRMFGMFGVWSRSVETPYASQSLLLVALVLLVLAASLPASAPPTVRASAHNLCVRVSA